MGGPTAPLPIPDTPPHVSLLSLHQCDGGGDMSPGAASRPNLAPCLLAV